MKGANAAMQHENLEGTMKGSAILSMNKIDTKFIPNYTFIQFLQCAIGVSIESSSGQSCFGDSF